MDKILERAKDLHQEIISIRRHIHAHPELSTDVSQTSALVRTKLEEYGITEIEMPYEDSVIATIRGGKGPGKTIGLRCDMDALPVSEDTGLDFSSKNENVMHACGHDIHTSMMLGNAKILNEIKDEFAGTIKLIFQHNEELQPGGSRFIVESGAVDDCDAFFGMHVFPTENELAGKIALYKGPVTTAADIFDINVYGKSAHGSEPHKGNDAILAACQINILMNQVQARNIAPRDVCILGVNQIEGGVARNIMPDHCLMTGTNRVYTEEARKISYDKVFEICKGVEAFSGCKCECEYTFGYDAVVNDDALIDLIVDTLKDKIGDDSYLMMEAPMGFSEDFSHYGTKTGKPIALMFLYAGNAGKVSSLHNHECSFNEECIPYGMAAMSNSALAFLSK